MQREKGVVQIGDGAGGNRTTWTQQMVASCSGAVLTSVFVTPLDVVKVRLQRQVRTKWASPKSVMVTPFDVIKVRLQSQHLKPGACFIVSNGLMDHLCTCTNATPANEPCPWFVRPGRFTGTTDAFVKIVRHEGVRSLWSGLGPSLVLAVPATVAYFTLYDNLNQWLRRTFGSHAVLSMGAGATARTVVVSMVSPLEMFRTRLQSERVGYAAVTRAIMGGMKSGSSWTILYAGWTATLFRDVPFSAIYWGGYEVIKAALMRYFGLTRTNFTTSFTAGACSGAFAALVTIPFDVIKTHQQIELGERVAKTKDCGQLCTLYERLKRLYRQGGTRALFTGSVPRLMKVAPACAIMIGTYEYLKAYFEGRNARERALAP